MTFCPIIASHFHPITMCRLLTSLRRDRVVFTDRSNPDVEMHPTEANRIEFTMRLRNLANWDRLCEDDLTYNNIRRAPFLSPRRQLFQDRLRRKRYIDKAIEDVRATISCCRLPDLRCSRYMCRSGEFGSLQRLQTHISRASSQRRLTHRNWTT